MPEPSNYDAAVFQDALSGAVSLQRLPALARYAISFFLVAAATVVAFALGSVVSTPNVALLYVLPVVVAARYCGWGASLFAVILSVLSFDFFFTVPYYSLTMTDPAEIWSAALLFVIATFVASLAADARRRAIDAMSAAERAAALQELAHAVVHAKASGEVVRVAAATLQRLFEAPSLVFRQRGKDLDLVAAAGGSGRATPKDREAAGGALVAGIATRGETYPTEQTYFDFWPVPAPGGGCVLGVDFTHGARERPAGTEQIIEAVAGYVAAALTSNRLQEAPLSNDS